MEFTALGTFIGQVGFPVFISVWLLTKGSKVIENNTNALNSLKENCNKKGS